MQKKLKRLSCDKNMEKYLTAKEIFEYKIICARDVPFSNEVVEACKANRCGKYGTCWTCPPGVGEPKMLQEKITSYKNAAVFTCKYDLEDSFDFETMAEGAKTSQKVLLDITAELKNQKVDFMALGCEGCILCEKCTYPDAPCRFPERAIPSVEACGVNVVQLAADIGVHYNNGPNTVTYFCVILYNG